MKKKILITCFADVNIPGGGTTLSVNVAKFLSGHGHDVILLSKGNSDEVSNEIPIKYHQINSGAFWRIPQLVIEKQIENSLKSLNVKPEVVLSTSPFYIAPARKVWSDVKIIYLFPCLLWRCLKYARDDSGFNLFATINNYLIGKSEIGAFKNSDIVLAQAATVQEDIVSFYPKAIKKIAICPTGVDDLGTYTTQAKCTVREQLNTPQKANVVLTVSHIDKNKNLSYVINNIKALSESNVYLWICGDGPELQELKSLVHGLNIESNVRFLGWRKDIADIYMAADIFVHAAFYDNFPNVYLEALVCGLPVCGPFHDFPRIVSPLKNIITHGTHGFLYDLNAKDGLASILSEFFNKSNVEIETMKKEAHDLALANYAWSNYVEKIESFF